MIFTKGALFDAPFVHPGRERAEMAQVFELWRQDDNGGRFLVECYSRREDAEAKLAALSRGAHKQFYWIVEADPARAKGAEE